MSRRAARLEIQRLVPSAAALRPSRVVANFQVTLKVGFRLEE